MSTRIRCPDCSSLKIEEVPDKSNVIINASRGVSYLNEVKLLKLKYKIA